MNRIAQSRREGNGAGRGDPAGGNAGWSPVGSMLVRYRAQSSWLVVLLILSGLAEGLGVLTLLPLLQIVVEGSAATGAVERLVLGIVRGLGFQVGVGPLLLVLVVALWLKGAFRWLAMKQVGYAVARVSRDLRLRLIRALLGARWRHWAVERSGEVATALSRDAFWGSYAYRHLVGVLAAAVQLAVYGIVVVLISWQVGAVAMIAAALLAGVLGVFVRMSRRAGQDQTRLSRSLVSGLLDVVGGLKAIKAMGRERWYLPILEEETRALERAERRQVVALESLQSFKEPLLALLLAPLVFWAVAARVPFATVLVGVFLFHRFMSRAHEIQSEYQGVAAAEAALAAVTGQSERAESEPEVDGGGSEPPRLDHEITLRGVGLSYGDRPVLEGVDLRIPARRMTVLAGPSGAGKTTLLDLIVGLRRPAVGEVMIDGIPLGELDLAQWRRRIGYVPQEPVLLDDTVARNVAMGEPVSSPAIERALRRAGAWGFVAQLPQGMETNVGERGATLSGGERQRIAVARALLHDPLLLVLDEATSELDSEAEMDLCEMLRSLRDEVTIVAASHARAVMEASDVWYEMRGGRVVGSRST